MFQVGEKALLIRPDEMSGKTEKVVVEVKSVKHFAQKPYYTVMLPSGEVDMAYPDELYRFTLQE